VPTLPGFGFSTPLGDEGWDTDRIARCWIELMNRLGYHKFGVQGGDIGASVSPAIGRAAPDRVVGVHVNGSIGMPVEEVSDEELSSMTDLERDRVNRVQAFMRDEFGYIAIQATRPSNDRGIVGRFSRRSPRLDRRKVQSVDAPTRGPTRRDHRARSIVDQRNAVLGHRFRGFGRVRRVCPERLGTDPTVVRHTDRGRHVRARCRNPANR